MFVRIMGRYIAFCASQKRIKEKYMSNRNVNFTPEQEAVIKHRGSSLLVSAAAGSGKTRTLVERLMDRVGDGDSIDEFLVITYTRAAASELRERINDEIHKRLTDAPENRNLRRQSLLCRCASIDTIHGFCTEILRENAHLAGIQPDFRVADEGESAIIKGEVLKDTLEKAYETAETSNEFRELIELMAGERDDRRVVGTILDVYEKLQSNPDPESWASAQVAMLSMQGVYDAAETAWGGYLMDRARTTAGYWLGEMERLREKMREFPPFDGAYGASVEASVSGIAAFLASLDGGWDEARRCPAISFPRPKSIAGFDQLKETRKRCKSAMEKCEAIFECSSDEHAEDMRAIVPAVTALFDITMEFGRAYSDEKRRRGLVDFSDLEHLALTLLYNVKTGIRTELARTISLRFKEIMVDEYQDVNAVQEHIFNAVSRDGENIFMVGDVKQSIYRFRLADPSIFLGKLKDFEDYDALVPKQGKQGKQGKQSNVKVFMSKNFRSKTGILDAVNLVFGAVMSKEFGEMDYTRREYLIPGREDDGEPAVEFDVIDMSGLEYDEQEESPGKRQTEARFIAGRIAELAGGGYMIPDGAGGSRRIRYSDIVILLRSLRDKAWQYASALTELGIPADLPGGEGYFETVEISSALSILSVIDNPMQDIPLAAALRGPAYGFTADELAGIRAESRDTDFYGALIKAAGSNGKCAAFLDDMEAMRTVAPDMPVSRFIWHMYNTTGLLGRVGAMPGSERRRNNLIALTEHARVFEQNGYKGLFGFLTYVGGLRERGAEPAPSAVEPAINSVRIMSIHKSKGLEFPIVILADTSKRFNYKDTQQPLVMHPDLGVGASRRDKLRRIEYPTLARTAVQSKLKAEILAEEMRALYVAMTRAREKLIITAVFPNAAREMEKLSALAGGGLVPQALGEIKNSAGWILAPLLSPAGGGGFAVDNEKRTADSGQLTTGNGQLIDLRIQGAEDFGDTRDKQVPGAHSTIPDPEQRAADPADVETLRERFGFEYPFPYAVDAPSKLTVTGLKGRQIDYEAADEAGYLSGQWSVVSGQQTGVTAGVAVDRGQWSAVSGRQTGLNAAQRGTALHLAMQHIDFDKCRDTGGVDGELGRMSRDGLLTREQRDAVDARKITSFFKSDIGTRVLEAESVKREFKFSLLYPAEYFCPGSGGDKVLFQGVIDCFFEEGGDITVIDFKTDRVTIDSLNEKVEYYGTQLTAYSDALERMTGKRVKERIIYFFELDRHVSV